MVRNVGYLIKEGIKNSWVDRLMTFASISVLTACLVLMGFSMVFSENINSIIGFVESQNEVVIYLKDNATQEDINKLVGDLKANSNIANVEYVSKDQALVEQKKNMGQDGSLLDGLEGKENPYPNSYRIKLKNLSIQAQTIDSFKNYAGIEKIFAQTNIAKTLTNLREMVSIFSVGLVLVLGFVSVIIVINTIRATIYARKKQLNIMRYVGASANFISLPYLIEGVFIGLISATIAYGILWSGYEIAIELIRNNASGWFEAAVDKLVEFKVVAKNIATVYISVGVGTTVIGSLLSIRKHLKV